MLYNVYTKPQYFDEIDTLTDLDNSALKISISSPVFFDLFGNNGTEVLRSLNEKFYFHDDDSQNAMARAATQGDVCMVERHSDIQLIIQVGVFGGASLGMQAFAWLTNVCVSLPKCVDQAPGRGRSSYVARCQGVSASLLSHLYHSQGLAISAEIQSDLVSAGRRRSV